MNLSRPSELRILALFSDCPKTTFTRTLRTENQRGQNHGTGGESYV